MPDAARAAALRERLKREGLRTEVLAGEQALDELAGTSGCRRGDGGIVGRPGCRPCLAAAPRGKRLLLANKEAWWSAAPSS